MNKKNYIILGILLCLVVAASGCTQNTGNNSTPSLSPQNNSTSNNSSTNTTGTNAIIAVLTNYGNYNIFNVNLDP